MAPRLLGATLFALLLVLLLPPPSSLHAQTLAIGNVINNPNSSDTNLGTPRTDIDLVSPATASGSLTTARFNWSASGCTNAAKIKFFRRQGNTLTLLTERGPFTAMASQNNVPLNPPVEVLQGDLIGITRLTDCGNPVASVGFPSAGYLAFGSDLTGSVTVGAPVQGVLAVSASGTATESVAAIIPVAASAPGDFGSFFRTSLQVHNPFPAGRTLEGRVIFHRAGVAGSFSDPSVTFDIAGGETVFVADIVPMFGLVGVGSIDIVTETGGDLPVIVVRVFNDAGAAGTTGFTTGVVLPGGSGVLSEVLTMGATGALLGPADAAAFRLNVGVRTLFSGATLSIRVLDEDGRVLRTNTRSYPPTYFEQVDAATFSGGPLGSKQTLQITATSGEAIVYGATNDNRTNDPSIQFVYPSFAVLKQ